MFRHTDSDVAARDLDPAGHLDQAQTEGGNGRGLELGSRKPSMHLLEKSIGSNVQEQPQLIGLKAMAARPVGSELALPLLDPVLDILTALAILLIHFVQGFLSIGHHEVLAHHPSCTRKGDGNDPARLRPCLGLIEELTVEPSAMLADRLIVFLGQTVQYWIAGECDGIPQPKPLDRREECWTGESGIHADGDREFWQPRADLLDKNP